MPNDESQPEFRTTAVLRHGSRTSLYRGLRVHDLLPVVIKVLDRDQYTAGDLEHLRSEFKIARRLEGMNSVVSAYGLILLDGCPAIALEDFGGSSLDQLIVEPLEIGAFLQLAISMTRALAEVHERSVVHRDIKPENFIIDGRTGEAKLTDFGISRIVPHGASIPSVPGLIEGSLPFISPEQTGRMNRPVDFRSDLYSLGATFYQMLTGEYLCDAHDALEWIHCHIARPAPLVHETRPHIPEMISLILVKLLAKLAEDRYETALGLKRDLERAAEAWERSAQIPAFPLGAHDHSDRFQLTPKLYGRQADLDRLVGAFERAASGGRCEAVLVAGYSGIGKSSLVHELYKPVVRTRGLFISGKFDQFGKNVPYSTLLQAFRGLIQQILSESEERLVAWKSRLQDELGSGAGVMVQMMPELELIIGPQPPVPDLGPAETLNRFNLVYAGFLQVFATADRPLVVFLDDMQWADGATLQLLETLLGNPEMKHVLFVLAYRDNETGPSHPFSVAVERLVMAEAGIARVQLRPLQLRELNLLVAESLRRDPRDTLPLALLVLEKTDGNPFFAGEFLKALYRDESIYFEGATQTWRWDEAKIRAREVAENVVDLMTRRIRRLQPETQEILKLASCVGNRFDLKTIGLISERPTDDVSSDLDEALQEGLVVPVTLTAELSHTATYRFQHDRIQQSADALMDPATKPATHLRIGRLLLRNLSSEECERRIFDVVNQVNQGLSLVESEGERREFAELNFRAGRRAKNSSAYATAETHFATAAAIHGKIAEASPGVSAWDADYAFMFLLHLELAESQYLAGALGAAETTFTQLLEKARTPLERADIYTRQIRLFQVAGDYREALRISLASFAELGLPAPTTDEAAAAAVAERASYAKARLSELSYVALLNAPRMVDPRIVRLMGLLEASGPPVYMVRPALFAWVTLQMLTLSLDHGNIEASCYAYGIYALMLAAVDGEVDSAVEFSELSIQLNEKFADPKLKGCMLHLLGDHVNFWKNPVATDLPILERGFRACVEGGDLIYSNYIAFQSIWHLWEKGETLERCLEYSQKYAAFAQTSKHRANYLSIRLEQQFLNAWRGMLPESTRLSDGSFDEDAALAEIAAADYGCGVVYYHIMRLVLAYSMGHYADALNSAELAEKSLAAAFSMPIEPTYWFFRALSSAMGSETGEALRQLEGTLIKFEKWAKNCPANFSAKYALLQGEFARLQGKRFEALEFYEQGARSAAEQGYVQFEALACELAERLYRNAGLEDAANTYGRSAHALYARWGASVKVIECESRLPKRSVRNPGAREGALTVTSATHMHQLDLISVVKASQQISSEIELPKLLRTLMNTVVEYAGAEKGVLLLSDEEGLTISAEAGGSRGATIVDEAEVRLQPGSDRVPYSVVTYVMRSGHSVMADDAWARGQFVSDPYVERVRPKSLLCLPILRHGNTAGLFYLENRHAPGVFNEERLIVLDLLASQIAISIENSRLFKASQDAVHVRDEFLSIASHELKTPLTALKIQTQMTQRNFAREGERALSPDRMQKFVAQTEKSVERLTRLVSNMLDISRLDVSQFKLERGRFDFADLLSETVENLLPLLEPYRCRVEVAPLESVIGIWDRYRIEQVVQNLVLNAAKYGAGGVIRISIDADPTTLRFSVRDEGMGIAKSDQKRIFERFERAISVNEVSGLGLGLYIARRIVRLHGGEISVESTLGKGSTFSVQIPRAVSADDSQTFSV